ncbi:hypothetical protein NFI96_010303 [Prochilodus magdalenae]|nr:hypothetical protein NFI96_010303 [Prochilodus magdalenae]
MLFLYSFFPEREMQMSSRTHQGFLIATCWLAGFATCLLFFQYTMEDCSSSPFPPYVSPYSEYRIPNNSDPVPSTTSQPEKPILLLWVWPENYRFDFSDCKTFYNIDDCHLTDDRNLYYQSDAVLIFHKAIQWNLQNLPPSPRPPFQRWIWFHVESPTNTIKIPGLENLFNLTLSYRRDADITVRNLLTVSKTPNKEFVLPKKDKLVCWFVSNMNPSTGTGTRMKFYEEFKKHIQVNIFGAMAGSRMKDEDYYPTMSSCKFYLSFENSVHKDYFTEKFNGPLAIGTVPVVLGPPRENYEQFAPPNSFIHVNDFPNQSALAQYLLQLDKDDEAYMRYFDWRKHVSATRHLVIWNQEFIPYICRACEYVGKHREYKQFSGPPKDHHRADMMWVVDHSQHCSDTDVVLV